MSNLLETLTNYKIKSFDELQAIIEAEKRAGNKIIQCHGVFDLLHPGHIRHFKAAKSKGDLLIVTVTPDRFVNKGPGRPVFTESLRLESIAALKDVDFVVLNDSPDAVSAIEKVRPDFYVKGMEYSAHQKDITGKITEEIKAVEACGGTVFYTDDIVFSSSSLLNRFFEPSSPQKNEFLERLSKDYSSDDVLKKVEDLSKLKVLVIGDAIIDEYQFTEPLGKSGKGLHMVARCLDKEVFLGGSLIIANHVAQFAKEVTLVTAVGRNCPYLNFIKHHLDPKVAAEFTYLEDVTTLVKKRYVLRDGNSLSKLFETYSGQEQGMDQLQSDSVIEYLKKNGRDYDLILSCDFGNGFSNPQIIQAISSTPSFLALNTQINSGNRGYNVVTNYHRADYISLNEPELRLAAHDQLSRLEGIASDICDLLQCKTISITRGVKGVSCWNQETGEMIQIPAFASTSVDRIGAGDSYLSLSSLCLANGYSPLFAGFIGSVAAAMSVQMVGNQEPIRKVALCKFLTRLLK